MSAVSRVEPNVALSFSKIDLALDCAWWAAPGRELPPDHAGLPARAGSAFHAAAASHVEARRPNLAELAERFDLPGEAREVLNKRATRWIERNPFARGAWRAEVAYAYNPVTGAARELGRNIDRKYVEAGLVVGVEIPGSIDLVRIEMDRVVVRDLKTGSPEFVRGPMQSGQLGAAALAACKTYGLDAARVEWEFVDEEGESSIFGADLDPMDLDALEVRLRDLWALMHQPEVPTNPGEGRCRYCPGRPVCPEHVKALARVAPEALDRRRLPIVANAALFVSPEHAAEQLALLKKAQAVLDAAELACKAYADEHGGIPLEDGSVWAAKEIVSANVNGRKVIEVAATLLAATLEIPVEEARLRVEHDAEAAKAITQKVSRRYEARVAGGRR